MGELEVPSLFNLCIREVTSELLNGNYELEEALFELPQDLFDGLTMELPPLALQKLQLHYTSPTHYTEFTIDRSKNGKKRGRIYRYGDLNMAWKRLFKMRWPVVDRQSDSLDQLKKRGVVGFELVHQTSEWHQKYWETHLQDCLDIAAEKAVLPSFDRCLGEIRIPGSIMESIGHKRCTCDSICTFSKLSYHCQQYGCYARCLRLQNVLCVSETCDLLMGSKLQSLVLRRIRFKDHVNGACKLISQNIETLSSLDFIYCKLPSTVLNTICESLFTRDVQMHGIQYFSIRASSILKFNEVPLPSGFLSFLSSGRSLCSLNFCDNHLGPNFARTVLDVLLDVSSGLSTLDLSDNNISGWLSNFTPGIGKSLGSLRTLNLRGNDLQPDDAISLRHCLLKMPNLEYLDISDNPIEDTGLRSLIPYFVEVSEKDALSFDVKLEKCCLSCDGVAQLLESLSHMKGLYALSIADNNLGSQIAVLLAKFLGQSCVRVLNIEDIELGSSGFQELTKELPEKVKLHGINVSKNRGGAETANFVSKLILQAPELVELNAGYNFMPSESLLAISHALKLSKGKLEQLDLTGNTACYQATCDSILMKFQLRGKPIVNLPSFASSVAPYDDDP